MRSAWIFALLLVWTVQGCGRGSAPPARSEESSAGGECPILTVADIKAITGTLVHPLPRLSTPGAGGTCANYATAEGDNYLGVNRLSSVAQYQASIESVPEDVYPEKEPLTGIGDEAVVFKAPGHIRYLVARTGAGGVVLFYAGESPTDDQLRALAIHALRAR